MSVDRCRFKRWSDFCFDMSEFRKRSAKHIVRHLLFSPYVAGTVTGSVALGTIPAPTFVLQCIQHFPESISGSRLATILSQDIACRICLFIVGFEAGFFVRKSVDWFRYWAIRRLLSYQEWVYGSKSWKNRVSTEARIAVFHKFHKLIQI